MTDVRRIMNGGHFCGAQVAKAIRRGELRHPREFACADCGAQAIEYDHRDYNKPLEVFPVCRRCNLRRGRAIPRRWNSTDELRERFQRCRKHRIVPWARQYCLERIEHFVSEVERVTEGAVTRYELRPDVFGEPPKRTKAAA